jgi:hypothetical protein
VQSPVAAGRGGGHRLAQLAGPLLVTGAQLLRPGAIDGGGAVAGRLDQDAQGFRRRGQDFHRAPAVIPQFARDVGDPHEPGRAEDRGRAVGELEVQPPADREHHVRVAHHRAAHGPDDGRVRVRDQAAAFARVEIDRAEAIEQRRKLGSRAPRAAPGDHEDAPGRPQDVDGLGDAGGIRPGDRQRLRGDMLLEPDGLGDGAAEGVDGEVDVGRSRLSAFPARSRDGLVELGQGQGGLPHGSGVAG